MKRIEGTPQERIEHNRIYNGDCWETRIDTHKKYPQLNINGKKQMMHRIAYLCYVGEVPKGLRVLHRCDNSRCHNPAHLFLGTQSDNMRDMVAKGRHKNGRKLLDIDEELKTLAHLPQKQIASLLGLAQPTISRYLIRLKLARGRQTSVGKGHGKGGRRKKEYSK